MHDAAQETNLRGILQQFHALLWGDMPGAKPPMSRLRKKTAPHKRGAAAIFNQFFTKTGSFLLESESGPYADVSCAALSGQQARPRVSSGPAGREHLVGEVVHADADVVVGSKSVTC